MAYIIKGTKGANKLDGTSGADEIYGYEGNDNLNGGLGNDLLEGGTGSDILLGGAGSDVYVFSAGSGRDTIRETVNGTDVDVIRFADLRPSHVKRVEREGSDLVIMMVTGDEIRIAGHYAGYSIEQIQFSDGTVWFGPNLNQSMRMINGTAGNDVIVGHSGIDMIDGKAGNDMLQGGAGGDTYTFAPGSGLDTIAETVNAGELDTIRFTTATPDQVSLLRKGSDLLVRLSTGDEVRVAGQYAGAGIEKIEFGNGVVWGANEIKTAPNLIIGTESNDVLAGTAGTDLIHGLDGNDVLAGGQGSDTYFYESRNGSDTIQEAVNGADTDILRLMDMMPDQVNAQRNGADLLLRMYNGEEIRIQGQYAGGGIERIEFGNGIVWGANEINAVANEIIGTESGESLIGTTGTDLIRGLGGDDMLAGQEGSDTYFYSAGDGSDTIQESMNAADTDILRLMDVMPDQMFAQRQGADLLLRLSNGESIRIQNQYAGGAVEKIEFGNGTIWGAAEINAVPTDIVGTASGESLTGTAGADLIHGLGGNDMLFGREGSDTYFYSTGDGRDIIQELPNAADTDILRLMDILPDQVNAVRKGGDLLLQMFNGEEIRIQGQYVGGGVEKIEFANGIAWGAAEFSALPNELIGTAMSDSLTGTAGTDLIYGMAGNDYLYGREGGDTYTFMAGDGRDTINEALNVGETDTLRILSGVSPSEIDAVRQGADMVLRMLNGDEVRVRNQYYGSGIEKIEFGNGTVWGAGEINSLPTEIIGTYNDDYMVGTSGNDRFYGLEGEDRMKGDLGSDTYFFKLGDDRRDVIYEVQSPIDVDRIVFDSPVRPDDVHLYRSGADLRITTRYGAEITVLGEYFGAGIEEIVFSDGTVWGAEKIGYYPPVTIQPVGVAPTTGDALIA